MTLADMLKRLREATGADRDLDLAICEALNLIPTGPGWKKTGEATWHKNLRWSRGYAEFDESFQPRPYTASLDAAIALVEKMLPGANWRIQFRDGTYKSSAIISREHPTKHFDVWVDRQGATPALALLIALLEALSAKGEPKP